MIKEIFEEEWYRESMVVVGFISFLWIWYYGWSTWWLWGFVFGWIPAWILGWIIGAFWIFPVILSVIALGGFVILSLLSNEAGRWILFIIFLFVYFVKFIKWVYSILLRVIKWVYLILPEWFKNIKFGWLVATLCLSFLLIPVVLVAIIHEKSEKKATFDEVLIIDEMDIRKKKIGGNYTNPSCNLPCWLPDSFANFLKDKWYSKIWDAENDDISKSILSFIMSESKTGSIFVNSETLFFGRDMEVHWSIGKEDVVSFYDYMALSELLRIAKPWKTMDETMQDPLFPWNSYTFKALISDERIIKLFNESTNNPEMKVRGIEWAKTRAENLKTPKSGNLFDFVNQEKK